MQLAIVVQALRQPVAMSALITLIVLLAGCSHDGSGNSVEDESQRNQTASPGQVRIISLSPAISRTLVDFGLQDNIVGRTPHCTSLDDSVPIVGDLLNADYEQIIRLKPTHVLVQPPQTGIDAHLVALAQQHRWTLGQWRLNSIEDVEVMVRELPGILFADGSPDHAEHTRRAATLLSNMASALAPGSKPVFRGRTLLVYRVEPVSVFGQGTYLDQMLKALGGSNASSATDWATLSLEDVVRTNPEAIILVRPLGDTLNVVSQLGSLWELDIEAVLNRRVAILTHADAFTPSTGLIGVAEELRTILENFEHP